MKNFLNYLQKRTKKKINDFIHDTENMEFPVLSEKHPYLKNSGTVRTHTVEETFFEIVFLKNYIEFKIISDLNLNYSFKTEIIRSIKKDIYEIEFTIFNKGNANDSLFSYFLFKDNNLLKSEFDDNLSIELKSKKTQEKSKNSYYEEVYIFNDNNIMSIIFDNYLNSNELSDILLLNDIDISNDDILKTIIQQCHIINDCKKNHLKLNSHTI